jgi:hypothetical protein
MKKLKVREAGGMMVSDPINPNRDPSLSQLLARELDKLRDQGKLSPIIYTIARDQAYAQSKVLNNIYSRNGRDLQTVLMLLLSNVRSRQK